MEHHLVCHATIPQASAAAASLPWWTATSRCELKQALSLLSHFCWNILSQGKKLWQPLYLSEVGVWKAHIPRSWNDWAFLNSWPLIAAWHFEHRESKVAMYVGFLLLLNKFLQSSWFNQCTSRSRCHWVRLTTCVGSLDHLLRSSRTAVKSIIRLWSHLESDLGTPCPKVCRACSWCYKAQL